MYVSHCAAVPTRMNGYSTCLLQVAESSVDDDGNVFEDAAGELEDVAEVSEGDVDKDGQLQRLVEDGEKPQLFNMWLKMKKEGRQNSKLQALVEATILPEDIHQHFRNSSHRHTESSSNAFSMNEHVLNGPSKGVGTNRGCCVARQSTDSPFCFTCHPT